MFITTVLCITNGIAIYKYIQVKKEHEQYIYDKRDYRFKQEDLTRAEEEYNNRVAELNQLRQENAQLRQYAGRLENELKDANRRKQAQDGVTNTLATKDAEISNLKQGLQMAKTTLEELVRKSSSLESTLAQKDATIAALNARLEASDKLINQLREDVSNKNVEIVEPETAVIGAPADKAEDSAFKKDIKEEKANQEGLLNCFQLKHNEIVVSEELLPELLKKISNYDALDSLFEKYDETNSSKRLFENYKKQMNKCVAAKIAEGEDCDLEDTIWELVRIVDKYIVRTIIKGIYRKLKNSEDAGLNELLQTINSYLGNLGFYTRNDLFIGKAMTDDDFSDLEFIIDSSKTGHKKQEILEIEYYPYYLAFDDDGEVEHAYTHGSVIIAG